MINMMENTTIGSGTMGNTSKTEHISIVTPYGTKELLKQIAVQEQRSVSWIVANLIKSYLKQKEQEEATR